MAKKIRISLVKSGVSVIAELCEDLAPKSCQLLFKKLPLKGEAIHARWGGNEIWMDLPPLGLTGYENETIFPSPGEILLVQKATGVCDIAIFYGKGWCFGPSGFTPGNHVATIIGIGNLNEFAKACNKVLLEGSQQLLIENAEK